MSVEVHPVGLRCNLKCDYCYESKLRHNKQLVFDLEAVKSTLVRMRQDFSLFGGEALLAPIKTLESLFSIRSQKNGVQTNGVLITDKHIDLFKRFNVHVGISIDGPAELNEVRCSLEDTKKTMDNIVACRDAGLACSVIVTLSKSNATPDRLPRLINWLDWLHRIGVCSFRLHFLETDSVAVDKKWSLTDEEMRNALEECYKLQKTHHFDIFTDVARLLSGSDESVTCMWNNCDYYSTNSVHSVRGDGTIGNCYRTGDRPKAQPDTFGIRRFILQTTPQERGGCKDCNLFEYCGGSCPATGLNQDWRNRSSHCTSIKTVFEIVARDVTVKHRESNQESHTDQPHGDKHGDHWDNTLIIGVAEVK